MKGRGRVAITLLMIVAVVGTAELAIRGVAGELRDPLVWWNWEAQNKVAMMDRLHETGGASVVFVGSSMVNAAGDPELLTRSLGLKRPAFNAALNGSGMRSTELWTRTVVVPRLRPRVVVVGFNSEALNDRGIQQQDFYERMIDSPLGGGLDGRGSVLDRVESWMTARSYLVRYRQVLRRPHEALAGNDLGKERASVGKLGELNALKTFLAHPYAPRPDRLVAGWDRALSDYTPGGRQLAALDLMVRDLTAQGITVVIARMPVTEDVTSLHPHGSSDRERFAKMLDDFVAKHPVTFFDAQTEIGGSTDLFVDPVHVNNEGSRRFSLRLAEVLKQVAA